MSPAPAHVALLVDAANLRAGLMQTASAGTAEGAGAAAAGPEDGRWGACLPADVARALMRYAGQVGRVTLARAYADWSRLGGAARDMTAARLMPVLVPASARGEDRSHIQLAVDALQALLAGDEPEAFLLVTGDGTLLPLVQALRADGSEVTVISCAAAADDELSSGADRFVTVEDVLQGAQGVPAPARDRSAAEAPAGGGFDAERGGWGGARPARAPRGGPAAPALGPEADLGAYDWEPFVRLIDELEQRLPFVGVRYLVNKVLAQHNCGTDDPRLKREILNRAQDEGLLEMFPVGNVGDRSDPVTACRLDREHATVVRILGPSQPPIPISEDPLRRALAPGAGGLAD